MDARATTEGLRMPRGWIRDVSPGQWLIDSVLGAVFALASLAWRGLYGDMSPAWFFLVVASMVAALMLSRVSPPLALAVAWGGAILQMLAGLQPTFANTAIFVVLFATAAYGTRAVYWAGFASAFVGAFTIVAYLYGVAWTSPDVPGLLWDRLTAGVLMFVAALFALLLSWTLGALYRSVVRAREGRLAQRHAEERAAAEEERGRIARDMHDVVAHSLAVVIAQADGARYAAASDPDAATAALGTISQTARAALSDVRLLLTQLRHGQFGSGGEAEGPQPTLADLEDLYAQVRAAGVDLRVDVDPAPPGTPPASAQLAVYRILQEALTNALRHGDGGPVDVALAWLPDRVELTVRNGVRADARPSEPGGHGLIGMRERAQLVGGRLDAGADAGVFTVRAVLPVERRAA
ncbi:sensor histidine kinase [Microbacterium sp. Root53]|uniref:sensor histidine kinase n=1 Tax=Microbacterium sp. Root53 TaxID=1736553 RepID=UPI000AD93428|nr:histidine kinase [Microbacterium sp. Root53]